ncbi:hypothetical protein [Persephonella sp.]|uniref:hypothetical protein n=1 Tax=Persephonella sp. TaxID=2060922 RepID=UPI0025F763F2|nr:hypothetical protein [Persephonella sp.]
MDILVILNNQKLRLEEIKDPDELKELVDQLRNISDEDIKKSISSENIQKINSLINEILQKVDQLKKETISEIKESGEKVKGVREYLKNI